MDHGHILKFSRRGYGLDELAHRPGLETQHGGSHVLRRDIDGAAALDLLPDPVTVERLLLRGDGLVEISHLLPQVGFRIHAVDLAHEIGE